MITINVSLSQSRKRKMNSLLLPLGMKYLYLKTGDKYYHPKFLKVISFNKNHDYINISYINNKYFDGPWGRAICIQK